jgi:hypothetical protein
MSRNKCFLFKSEYHMFYVLYPFVTYSLTLPRTCLQLARPRDSMFDCMSSSDHGPSDQHANHYAGRAIAQAASPWTLTVDAQFQFQGSLFDIFMG